MTIQKDFCFCKLFRNQLCCNYNLPDSCFIKQNQIFNQLFTSYKTRICCLFTVHILIPISKERLMHPKSVLKTFTYMQHIMNALQIPSKSRVNRQGEVFGNAGAKQNRPGRCQDAVILHLCNLLKVQTRLYIFIILFFFFAKLWRFQEFYNNVTTPWERNFNCSNTCSKQSAKVHIILQNTTAL